jgi:hypothetical protein
MASSAKQERDEEIIDLTDVVEEGQPPEGPARSRSGRKEQEPQAQQREPQEEGSGSEQDELDAAFSRLFADEADSGSSSEDPDIEFGSFFDEMDDTAEGLKEDSGEEQPEIELSDIEEISDLEPESPDAVGGAQEESQGLDLSVPEEESAGLGGADESQGPEKDWDMIAEKDSAESELDENFDQIFGSEAAGADGDNSEQGLEGAEIDLESLFDELDKASKEGGSGEEAPEGIAAPGVDSSEQERPQDLELEDAAESSDDTAGEETSEDLNVWLDQLEADQEEEEAGTEEPEGISVEEPPDLEGVDLDAAAPEETSAEPVAPEGTRSGERELETDQEEPATSPGLQARMQEMENRLRALEEQSQASAEPDISELESRIAEIVDSRLQDDAFWSRLQELIAGKVDESLKSGLDERLQELQPRILEAVRNDEAIPDTGRLESITSEMQELKQRMVSRDELDGLASRLQEDVSRQIRNAVPDAAAQVVREEIRALQEELRKPST